VKPGTRIFFALLRTAIGVGLLVYLGVSGAIHWGALLGLAAAWQVTLAALALLLLDMCAIAWRLCVLFRPRGLHLSLASSVRLTLIGIFFNACLPGATGGDVMKIYYALEGNRGRRTEVTTVILLDRAAGMFALVLWPLAVAPLFPELVSATPILRGLLWAAAGIAAMMLAGLAVCSSSRVRNSRALAWAFRLPLGNYARAMFDTVHGYRSHLGTLAAAVGISMLAHTMAVGGTLLAADATNPVGATWRMAVLIPLGHLANTLPITPGGLGVGEAAFNKLFALAGLEGGAEALLGWRLLTILMGLAGLVFYLQGRKRFVRAGEAVPT